MGTVSAITESEQPLEGPLSVAAVQEQTTNILGDSIFRKSPRSSRLLKFIVDNTLSGKGEHLKERIIGVQVFGRTSDYDSGNDPTVRVAALDVRKRLTEYYSKIEHRQELRISVPAGQYVAKFKIPDECPTNSQPASKMYSLRYWKIWATAGTAILAWSVWISIRLFFPSTAIDKFWAPILKSDTNPLFLCIASSANTKLVSALQASVNDDHMSPPYGLVERRLIIGPQSLTAAGELATFLQSKGKESVVRPVGGDELAELRFKPVVLYGMFLNEMAVKLGADLRFRLVRESEHGLRWIEDRNDPTNRKWSLDMSAPYEQVGSDYALVTRMKDPTTGQWWIGIAGLTGEGTLAANRMMIDPEAMTTIGPRLPKGWEYSNLQIVIQTKLVLGTTGAIQVVDAYSW
jgi:hypothetical protein